MSDRLPTYFISHGGGPWPWLADLRAQCAELEASLKAIVAELPHAPKAVLMISGHWESETPRIMASPKPPMVYDYHGFPAHTYDISYPAPGDPALADRVLALFTQAGIDAALDHEQGFDHGSFVPLEIMFPQADVPVVQISILSSYRPEDHFAMGRALASLREEGVLIIGSGLSYHNLRNLGPRAKEPSAAFDGWLRKAMALPAAERMKALANWSAAPSARDCHPEEDHLVPLFIALAAAENEPATIIYHEDAFLGSISSTGFRFG